MKRILPILLLAFTIFSANELFAQTKVTIGTDQFFNTGGSNPYGPIKGDTVSNSYNRHAYIYSDSLFLAINHGDTIRSIAFNRRDNANNNAFRGQLEFKIWMNNISFDTYGLNPINWQTRADSGILVYNGNPEAILSNHFGYLDIPLTTPYIWDTTKGAHFELICEYYQDIGQEEVISFMYDRETRIPQFLENQTKYLTGTGTLNRDTFTTGSNVRHPNIRLHFNAANKDFGLVHLLNSTVVYLGESINPTVIVVNDGLQSQSNVTVTATTNSGYSSTKNIASLNSFERTTITFDPLMSSTAGNDVLNIYTNLTGDADVNDDTISTGISYYNPIAIPGIYKTGDWVNGIGTGAGGADESIIVAPATAFGVNANIEASFRRAEDFTVPTGKMWQIDSFAVFGYQTGSTTASTIISMPFRIWDGMPNEVGSTMLYEDTILGINKTYWSGVYRVSSTTTGTATNRPVMKVTGDFFFSPTTSLQLGEGTYWIDYSFQEDPNQNFSGPWNPLLSMAGIENVGNAISSSDSGRTWATVVSGGRNHPHGFGYLQGHPMEVYYQDLVSVEEIEKEQPKISQNYPNPYNGITYFRYELTQPAQVSIEITDMMGRKITSLVNAQKDAGRHFAEFNGSKLSSGIYFYTFRAGTFSKTLKMIVK